MGTRGAALMVAVVAVGGWTAACGGGGGEPPTDRGGGSRTTQPSGDAAAAYVGLSTRAAIARAEAEDRPWRIGREDDEQFAVTQDFVEDRVTFEIDDGEVTRATLG